MKKIVSLLCLTLSSSVLCGCAKQQIDETVYENTHFYISGNGKNASAAEYIWDMNPEHTDIIIPDKADGVRVTALGGYNSSGDPAPFMIMPGNDDYIWTASVPSPENYLCPVFWQDLVFTVHVGKNVTEFARASDDGYYGIRDDYGNLIFYHPVCYFECDSDNRTFYSEEGRLYERKTGDMPSEENRLLPTGEYGPLFDRLSFRKKLSGRYVSDNNGGSKTVIEVCDSLWMIMLNISEYLDDELFEYRGAAVIPKEAIDMNDTETVSVPVDIYTFYESQDPDTYMDLFNDPHPAYTMTITEDALIFDHWDGNGSPLTDGKDNIVLERDHYAPSLFPSHPSDTYFLFADAERRTGFDGDDELISGCWQSESMALEIRADQTIAVQMKDTFVPSGYRGICSTGSDGDLRFVMAKIGCGTGLYSGRIHYEPAEGTIQISTVDGYDSEPLIPQKYYQTTELFPLELN
ncbi:MAG: hypothetical protein E7190_08390 [Erysipelotrichaceae bacterium]|nr:hypothetical protein [Erysipelotrichaceae bacterium]